MLYDDYMKDGQEDKEETQALQKEDHKELKDYMNIDDFKVGKEDIINIAISKYEDDLNINLKSQNDKYVEIGNKIEELSEGIKQDIKNLLHEKFDDNIECVKNALSNVGIDIRGYLDIDYSYVEENRLGYFIHFELINAVSKSGITKFNRQDSIEKPKDILQKENYISSLKKQRAEVSRVIDDINNNLSNIDNVIRRSKSALTKQLLSKFKDGEAIIENLLGSIDPTKLLNK